MTTYSFDQLRDAVQECTSYDLVQRFSDDEDEFLLIDPYGDVDGEPFYDLSDVEDFIRNNDQDQVDHRIPLRTHQQMRLCWVRVMLILMTLSHG
jgi:hypothetical protein